MTIQACSLPIYFSSYLRPGENYAWAFCVCLCVEWEVPTAQRRQRVRWCDFIVAHYSICMLTMPSVGYYAAGWPKTHTHVHFFRCRIFFLSLLFFVCTCTARTRRTRSTRKKLYFFPLRLFSCALTVWSEYVFFAMLLHVQCLIHIHSFLFYV